MAISDQRRARRYPTEWLLLALVVATAIGCGDGSSKATPATATVPPVPTATATESPSATPTATQTPTATPDVSLLARFAEPGPYVVGWTTLNIGDRDIEVWYPVDPGTDAGASKASYLSFDVLPPRLEALLPPELNILVPMEAYRDLKVSGAGPFPILTFSHGAGGFPLAYSAFLSGVASHGFVVASLDHLEWGLLAQVGLRPPGVDRDPGEVVLAAVSRLSAASADGASPLAGGVDPTRIATAGHSAGGSAAFALPDRPEVKAMLGFATGPSGRNVVGKPILLLVGSEDGGAGSLEATYDALSPLKRFVSVDTAGHNSFTDQCAIIHGGNDFLTKLVESGFPIPEQLLDLARDGCRPENLPPSEFWKIAQHFTVAHLRAAFGLDDPPVGLGDGIVDAFSPVTLRLRHAEDAVSTAEPAVLGFVVSGFASISPTHADPVCPNGFNLSPPEHVPPLTDDCANPTANVDPLFQRIEASGTVDALDLDGVTSSVAAGGACAHDDFVGPAGEPGIDLQYWRAVGCVRGFQPGEIVDIVVDQAVRDGSMTILIELWGVDDLRNDDAVRVQVFASSNAPPLGADGSVLPHGTLSVHGNSRYHSTIGSGRIVDGVLIAGPLDFRLRLNIQIVSGDLTFHDGWVRLALNPDGSAHGALFGFHPVEEVYDVFGRKARAAGALALGYSCSGLYAALTSSADGDYDPVSDKCTSLSVGYQFDAVPAFVAR